MKKIKIKDFIEMLKVSAVMLLFYVFITILLSCVLFFCHININSNIPIFTGAISVFFVCKFYKNVKKSKIVASIFLTFAIVILSIIICIHTYDLTWDGNTYHKLAIGILKDGWNPVYENAKEFIDDDVMEMAIEDDGRNSIWIEHYPKASWIFAANIYSATNNIEAAKIINILFLYIGFCIVLDYLYNKNKSIISFIIAFLIILNPISIVQVLNFYIDGLMGICFYIIISCLVALTDRNNNYKKKENMLILAMTLIICINLKFTGLIYSVIFCFMFFIFWIYRAYREQKFKDVFKEFMMFYIIVGFVAIFIVGINPYIKNIKNKGHPFYPIMGREKEDIMSYNQPISFAQKGSLEKFFISMFSVGDNIKANSSDKDPSLKIPFTTTKQEISQYYKPDLRMSGFGVLFSGIMIVSMVCLIWCIYQLWKGKEKETLLMVLAFLIVSVILVIITDGSWWARYVPYIYLFPILTLFLFARDNKRSSKIIAIVLATMIIINNGIIFKAVYKEYNNKYALIKSELINMKSISRKNGKVKIFVSDQFSSLLYNFIDNNIKVEKVADKKQLKNKKYINYFYYQNS